MEFGGDPRRPSPSSMPRRFFVYFSSLFELGAFSRFGDEGTAPARVKLPLLPPSSPPLLVPCSCFVGFCRGWELLGAFGVSAPPRGASREVPGELQSPPGGPSEIIRCFLGSPQGALGVPPGGPRLRPQGPLETVFFFIQASLLAWHFAPPSMQVAFDLRGLHFSSWGSPGPPPPCK